MAIVLINSGGKFLRYSKLLTCASALAASLGLILSSGNVASAANKTAAQKTTKTETKAASKSDATDSKKISSDESTNSKKQPKQVTTSYEIMTKVAGNKNYKVWQTVSDGKVHKKVADGSDFRYAHIQSNQSIKTKKYTYWLIYVNGRRVGWVNENYFARNTIQAAKKVSLVRNESPDGDYDTKNAISYATDATGTVVDNDDVSVSKSKIDASKPKNYNVKYTYGSAKATVKFYVRKSTKEGMDNSADNVTAKSAPSNYASWNKHYGASINYLNPQGATPETSLHTFSNNGLTLTTKFYQPVFLSVQTTADDGPINRVGHIPEGLTVSNDWAYTSLLSDTSDMKGHIVGYDLSKLTSPYNAQYLTDTSKMSQKKFNNYVKHIKVSPYIPVGHGQALGSTDKYIYALVNDHTQHQTDYSEELVQIRKSDMNINQIWTIKTWNNGDSEDARYYQNAVVVDDHTMYGLYQNKEKTRFEYWKLTRKGSNWYSEIIGATDGSIVTNSAPVQGFAYDPTNNNFYIGFNDVIAKIGYDGTFKDGYKIVTGREVEGLSVYNNRLYVNLAQRAELLESNKLTK